MDDYKKQNNNENQLSKKQDNKPSGLEGIEQKIYSVLKDNYLPTLDSSFMKKEIAKDSLKNLEALSEIKQKYGKTDKVGLKELNQILEDYSRNFLDENKKYLIDVALPQGNKYDEKEKYDKLTTLLTTYVGIRESDLKSLQEDVSSNNVSFSELTVYLTRMITNPIIEGSHIRTEYNRKLQIGLNEIDGATSYPWLIFKSYADNDDTFKNTHTIKDPTKWYGFDFTKSLEAISRAVIIPQTKEENDNLNNRYGFIYNR